MIGWMGGWIDGWRGKTDHAVVLLGESPKRRTNLTRSKDEEAEPYWVRTL